MKRILELEFAIGGVLRYLSHLELQRGFARLILRAQAPLRFSRGFNPRVRISLPVPRTVGTASLADRARVELETDVDPDALAAALRVFVPAEMEIHRAWLSAPDRLTRPTAITWRIDLDVPDPAPVVRRIEEIAQEPIHLTRTKKKAHRDYTVDGRAWLIDLAYRDRQIWAKVAYGPDGTIRPGELLDMLRLPKPETLTKMTRMTIEWN